MAKKFAISKFTLLFNYNINCNITIISIIKFLKNNLKIIKEICHENASKFK